MPYPTGSDLATFLSSRGFTPGDLGDLDGVMSAACRQWEEDTGFRPFVYAGATSERLFQMSGGNVLFLNSGLVSATGLVLEIDDTAYTINTDFWLRRPCDGLPDWPYTQVEFAWNVATDPDKISITGRWGFCEALNDDMKRAILNGAAAEWMREMKNEAVTLGGTPQRIRQGGVEIEFGTEGADTLQKQFEYRFSRGAGQYAAPWKLMA